MLHRDSETAHAQAIAHVLVYLQSTMIDGPDGI